MMRTFSAMALAMALMVIACTKVTEAPKELSNLQAGDRKPNGWTPSFPTAFEDWFEGPNQIRFCDGLGWNCWPGIDGEPYWIWNLPKSLAWPYTEPVDNSGPLVQIQWETEASIKMQVLTAWPSYDEVLESAGGDEGAATRAYALMQERVNVPSPVALDPVICKMLIKGFSGQTIQLLPGQYHIKTNSEHHGEVVIPVEIIQ